MPNRARTNKHDRGNMHRAVAKRHDHPSDARKFPNKDNVHPVQPGKKGETNDDSRHPSQMGAAATSNKRKRTLNRS